MSEDTQKTLPALSDAEPSADWSPAPVLLVGLFALLVYWGLVYLEHHGGEFDGRVYFPYKNYTEVDGDGYHPPEDPQIKMGREVYKACAACHQPTALGVPGQYPPLVASDWVNNKSPNRIIRMVLNGAQGPITVNGQSFNNNMLAWKAIYTDEQLAAVLTYVRQNKEWKNNAPAVTPAQVKAIRDKIKSRDSQFSPDKELLNLGPDE